MSLSGVCNTSNIGICAYRIKMDVLSDKIVFCTGDLKESIYIRGGDFADVYLLDTKSKSVHRIMEKKDIASLGWRKINGNSELWVSAISDTIWPWRRPKYQLIAIQKNDDKVTTKSIRSPNIVSAIAWNPSGEILAGKPKRDFVQPLFDDSNNIHSIGISLNEGKNAFIYLESPVNAMRLFWKDDRTFYAQDVFEKAIMEFHVHDKRIVPGNVFEYGDKITLFGIFESDLVYRRNGNLYINDRVVYESKTGVEGVKISPPYVFFSENSSIVVSNIIESKIYKKNVENANIFNIGLSLHSGRAYWLSSPNKIYSWNFIQDEIDVVLDWQDRDSHQ